MRDDFGGYLGGHEDQRRAWREALRARRYAELPWAGDPEHNPAALLLAEAGTARIYNDGATLAAVAGQPWLAPGPGSPSAAAPATLVERLRCEGPAGLPALTGAFALAVCQPARGEALLAVDRFAIENLFYVVTNEGLAFATRAQVLAAHPRIAHRFSAQAVYDYLYFHCLPGPDAGYAGVHRLPAGHYAWYRNGRLETGAWWAPDYRKPATPAAARAAALPGLVEQAVARRLDGDTAACFLSGGLDSSTVAGMCAKLRPGRVTAFTIGFDAEGYDEMAFARSVADHFGTAHAHYYVKPADIVASLPDIVGALDGPFGNASAVPTYFCAKLAREHGFDVILAGDGGDELFGGNARYATQLLFELYGQLPGPLRRAVLEPLARHTPDALQIGPLAKALSYVRQAAVPLPDRLMTYNLLNRIAPASFLTDDFLASVDLAHPLARLRTMDQAAPDVHVVDRLLHLDWQLTLADSDLPKVTRMSALAGIDVRFPLLDEAVFDFAAALPAADKVTRGTLRPLYRAAFRTFLPQATLTKRKQGFGLPFGVWLARDATLKAFADAQLAVLEQVGILRSSFRGEFLDGRLREHPAYFGVLVWILMTLGLWFARGSARLAGAGER